MIVKLQILFELLEVGDHVHQMNWIIFDDHKSIQFMINYVFVTGDN